MISQRDPGLDLLKIISMFFICTHHILLHGGNIINDKVWLLNIIVYNGLYIFPLITGYVSYKSNFKLKRIIELWFQAIFYTVSFTILFWIISKGQIWEGGYVAFTPIIHKTYWYLNCHLKLLIVMPVINLFLGFVKNRKQSLLLIVIIAALLIKLDSVLYDNFITFVLIYLVGALLAKLDINKLVNNKILFVALYIFGIWLVYADLFVERYIVLQNLIPAISLLFVFSKLRFSNQVNKIIHLIVPLNFGVYLIHDNTLVRNNFITKINIISHYNGLSFLIIILASALLVFVTCIFIEYLRVLMFNKLKINWHIETILKNINKFVKGFVKKQV